MIVTQLAERLLLTLEVRGSNPVIDKIYIEHRVLSTVLKRVQNIEKEVTNAPF